MTVEGHLRRALEALSAAARERLARHPLGHLLTATKSELELTVKVPLAPPRSAPRAVERAAAAAGEDLTRELEALLAHRAAFRPGRVFCLRCAAADCEHSAPGGPREVFAGYGPSGIPRFLDFGQWLLERQHPEIDRIYQKPPRLVTDVVSGRELNGELLPAFRDRQTDYRIHGQVVAGWFRIAAEAGAGGGPGVLALSFQVLSSAVGDPRRRGRRRLALNVLGAGEGGEPLESLYHRLERIPWTSPVRWSQSVLRSIEGSQGRAGPELLSRRIEGVLTSIARRLEQDHRSHRRRTPHAQRRHAAGDRPTRMALEDLARAGDAEILVDERRRTTIVLGERGRAHVWNVAGKLVTSIRYSPDSIERKRKQKIWRPARPGEILELRKAVGVGRAAGGDEADPPAGPQPG